MQVKRQPPISSIGGTVSNKERLKRTAAAVVKHIHTNALQYVTLIGALTQDDYSVALTCLEVIALRAFTGAIQQKINRRRKDDTDQQNDQQQP